MRCRYSLLKTDSSLRCCGLIEPQESSRRIDSDFVSLILLRSSEDGLVRALTRPAAVLMVPGPALASQLPSVLTARVSGGKLAPRAKLAALKQVPPSQMLKRAARARPATLRSRPGTNRPSAGRVKSKWALGQGVEAVPHA